MNSGNADQTGQAARLLPDVLSALNRAGGDGRHHPLSRYESAFASSTWRIAAVIAVGGDSLVLKRADGLILHITNKTLTPELGTRFFDLPMVERGAVASPGGLDVFYFVQPEAETPVSESAMRAFQRLIEQHGWLLSDRSQRQLGRYEGETKLLDPFAVERMPFRRR